MTTVDRIVATLCREWAYAVQKRTWPLLFKLNEQPTDILPSPSGPPVYVEGGVPAGSYTFRVTSEVLTAAEYQTIRDRMAEVAPLPPSDEVTVELPETRPDERNTPAPAPEQVRLLTPAERKRNAIRALSDAADEGRRYGR